MGFQYITSNTLKLLDSGTTDTSKNNTIKVKEKRQHEILSNMIQSQIIIQDFITDLQISLSLIYVWKRINFDTLNYKNSQSTETYNVIISFTNYYLLYRYAWSLTLIKLFVNHFPWLNRYRLQLDCKTFESAHTQIE